MAFPANLTTVTVVGSFITPEGTPSTGTVTFTASSWLTNSGANLSIPNSAVTKTLGTAGDFTATIPITDDADISPTGWVYTVAEVVDGVSRSYDVTIPGTVVAGGTVYLADLTPAAAAGPEYYSLASSLSIGTVSTLAAGSAATATITGLAPNQTLNLGIPTGPTGATGSAATIAVGSTSSVSNSGTAAVTNVGSSSAGTFNFVLRDGPTGPTGATGPTGPQGSAATVTVGTIGVTAYPGPGTVTNSGTSGAAVLDFTLTSGPANSLAVGSVTKIAAGGTPTATITGTAPSQTLSLGLVTGDTGTVASSGSGSVGTAAVSPTGDPDTGIYYPAANQVAITTGGTQALLLSGGAVSNPTFTGQVVTAAGDATTPAIAPTGDTNNGVFFPAADTVAVTTGGTERVRVSSTGNVGIGTSSPGVPLQIVSASANQPQIRMDNTNTDASAPLIQLRKLPSDNSISANDSLGSLQFQGIDSNGTALRNAAYITAIASSQGTNFVEGNLDIYTTNSSGTTSQKFRIDGNGLITGTGTSLGAWTSWTPTYTGITLGNGTIEAVYARLGKIVVARIALTVGSTSTFAASTALSFSLPVTAMASDRAVGSGYGYDSSAGTGQICLAYLNTTTTVRARRYDTIGAFNDTVPWTWATDDQIRLQFTYEAA